jgi:hypothetical protein
MMSLNIQDLVHWLVANGSLLAIIATAGVAILLVCCLECTDCPGREKDELFRHHSA